MIRWLIRLLFGSEHPSTRRIMACEDAVQALDARVNAHYDELKATRGAVSRLKRELLPPEDAPQDPIEQPDIAPPHVSVQSTEHLSRRFRGF